MAIIGTVIRGAKKYLLRCESIVDVRRYIRLTISIPVFLNGGFNYSLIF